MRLHSENFKGRIFGYFYREKDEVELKHKLREGRGVCEDDGSSLQVKKQKSVH